MTRQQFQKELQRCILLHQKQGYSPSTAKKKCSSILNPTKTKKNSKRRKK